MNGDDSITATIPGRDGHFSIRSLSQHRPEPTDLRMMELEIENSRLQRLIAELLLKNQRLREAEE
jgi:hypothetical protein